MVQQVMRVTVAVSAHHHQGNKGGQENGGQHPNGHYHHCLHGDSGSHDDSYFERKRLQSGSADCPSSIMDGRSSVERRISGSFSRIGVTSTRRKEHYRHT